MERKSGLAIASGSVVALLAVGITFGIRSVDSPTFQDQALDTPGSPGLVADEATPFGDGAREGIQVHGHWRLEVRDPDGTTVTVREFENALFPEGANSLARFLGRVAIPGEWNLILGGTDVGPCLNQNNAASVCQITETSSGPPQLFPTLTVTVPSISEPGSGSVILSGTATAARDGNISQVSTAVQRLCSGGGSNEPECGTPGHMTTGTSITPIPVQTGQSILATVTLSFS